MKSIYNLDAKKVINFLEGIDLENVNLNGSKITEPNIIEHHINNVTLWEIDNFICPEICSRIIDDCNKSNFEKVDFRPMERLICWDQSNNLVKLIESNLTQWTEQLNESDKLNGLDKLDHWEIPRGFGNNFIVWEKNKPKINQCLRVNKYKSNIIPTHRDAQYTQSKTVKSNYTLLIYLNRDEIVSGGETEFIFPTNEYEHNGLTIKQELNLIGNNYSSLKIKPKTGKAIIFPHFLLHGSTQLEGVKYVLRTDLICFGRLKEFYPVSKAVRPDDYICYENSWYSGDDELNIYNKYMYEYGDIDEDLFDNYRINSESDSDNDSDNDLKIFPDINFSFDPKLDSNYDVINLETNPNLASGEYSQIKLDIWLNLMKYKYINYESLVKIINKEINNKKKNFNNLKKHINENDLKELTYLPSKSSIKEYFYSMNKYYLDSDEDENEDEDEYKDEDDSNIKNNDNRLIENKLDLNEFDKNYIIQSNNYSRHETITINKKKHYILRDRYYLKSNPSNKLETKIESLAKKLFRQAQLNELENINLSESSDLYEIVLSLRVEPRKITQYPEHLEKLLESNTNYFNNQLSTNDYQNNYPDNIDVIELESRNGEKYTFDYEQKFLNHIDIIKICILFAVYTSVYEITDERVEHQIKQISNLLNLDNEFIFRKKIKQKKSDNNKLRFKNKSWRMNDITESKSKDIVRELFQNDDYYHHNEDKIEQNDILDIYKKKYHNFIPDQHLTLDDFKSIEEVSNNLHPLCLSADLTNFNIRIPWNDCCMCDYDECYYRCVFKDDIDKNFYCNIQWNLVTDDFLLELVDIEKSENFIGGTVNITTCNKTFNHASCQTFYDFERSSIKFHDTDEDFAKFYRTTWNIKWELSEKYSKVTIYLEPKVVM
jgi:hypothetical protein